MAGGEETVGGTFEGIIKTQIGTYENRNLLGEVPLGLLELALRRVIRENTYNVVPLPGVVWAAVRRELGEPCEIGLAMENWVERKWQRMI
jgi:hypothetical protein